MRARYEKELRGLHEDKNRSEEEIRQQLRDEKVKMGKRRRRRWEDEKRRGRWRKEKHQGEKVKGKKVEKEGGKREEGASEFRGLKNYVSLGVRVKQEHLCSRFSCAYNYFISVCVCVFQARTKELEGLQQKVEELQAQVQSMEGTKGWFERRLKEAEVSVLSTQTVNLVSLCELSPFVSPVFRAAGCSGYKS